jgi:hypothetical protein
MYLKRKVILTMSCLMSNVIFVKEIMWREEEERNENSNT